jgi:hypothetical protein
MVWWVEIPGSRNEWGCGFEAPDDPGAEPGRVAALACGGHVV